MTLLEKEYSYIFFTKSFVEKELKKVGFTYSYFFKYVIDKVPFFIKKNV